jgi:hypothetical protein
MRHSQLTPQFVEVMPDVLQDGVLYVSMVYALTAHRCACGCGEEVITPLSPNDWHLQFDGEHVSLTPSIGNWNFACRSHYWVKGNRIRWAGDMSQARIDGGRVRDRVEKAAYYADDPTASIDQPKPDSVAVSSGTKSVSKKTNLWKRVQKLWGKE